jgi:transposase
LEEEQLMARLLIGVDAGKQQHHAAAYDPGGDRVVGRLKFAVSREGFQQLRAFLTRLTSEPKSIVLGLEASGHYHLTLIAFLVEQGDAVVLLNPFRAAQFRQSQGRTAKTARIDAESLARFLATQALLPLTPSSDHLATLRDLTRFRAEQVRERTATINRLHAAVDLAFPELLQVLGRLTNRSVLALLGAYPTAALVAEAEPGALTVLLQRTSQGHVRADRVVVLQSTARHRIAVRSGASALALQIRLLVPQVVALSQQIEEVEEAIAQTFRALGHHTQDFPAGSVVALATLVAEIGDIQRFPSVKKFLAPFGWCPGDKQSGKSKSVHPQRSKAGNRYLRRIIWMLAVGAVRYPGPYQDYFLQRTAAGKNKMDSLVAVGRKLLTTMYAILKSGHPYDPGYAAKRGLVTGRGKKAEPNKEASPWMARAVMQAS